MRAVGTEYAAAMNEAVSLKHLAHNDISAVGVDSNRFATQRASGIAGVIYNASGNLASSH